MNSLNKKCQELKDKYDACFNNWFSDRFLKGNFDNECEAEFRVYQKCVKEAIQEEKIELWHIDDEALEKKQPSEPKKNTKP